MKTGLKIKTSKKSQITKKLSANKPRPLHLPKRHLHVKEGRRSELGRGRRFVSPWVENFCWKGEGNRHPAAEPFNKAENADGRRRNIARKGAEM